MRTFPKGFMGVDLESDASNSCPYLPIVGAQCGSDVSDQAMKSTPFFCTRGTVCPSLWLFVILFHS